MRRSSSVAKFISSLALGGGVSLCALAVGLAGWTWLRSAEDVLIEAENLTNIRFAKDVAATHSFTIVNRTGRRIWLLNEQGWG